SSNPEECLWFIFALRCRLGDAPDQYRHPVRLGLAQANLLVSLNYDLVRETNSKAEEPPIAARTRETRKVDPRDETRIPDEDRQPDRYSAPSHGPGEQKNLRLCSARRR